MEWLSFKKGEVPYEKNDVAALYRLFFVYLVNSFPNPQYFLAYNHLQPMFLGVKEQTNKHTDRHTNSHPFAIQE